jgi:NAD(P)-dependent dehydrogenase (short-subunit alcohol dehydrogenase family)
VDHFHPAQRKIQEAGSQGSNESLKRYIMNALKSKTAVVTGASKGIGKAIALTLAAEGANVVLSARGQESLEKTEKEVSALGGSVLSVISDVRKAADVERLARAAEKEFGTVQILVNNAGIGKFKPVVDMNDEDFHSILETNLYGVFYCCRAFLPGMIKNQGGHIVNISSLAGKNSFAGGSAYCASKHALMSFAECMMLEVRHNNIKVSTICPGSVATDFSHPSDREMSWALTSEDVAKAVLDVLTSSAGSLASLVDLRPLKPPQKK